MELSIQNYKKHRNNRLIKIGLIDLIVCYF